MGKSLPILGTASGLHRTINCQLSQLLPQTAEVPDSVKAKGERGTALHTALQYQGAAKLYSLVDPRYHKLCGDLQYEKTAGRFTLEQHRELKFVYDLKTEKARVHWSEQDRDYGELQEHEVAGTADVVIPGFVGFEIWDYKSGDPRSHIPAAENPQLLFLALCTALTICPEARFCVVGIQKIHVTKAPTNYYDVIKIERLAEFRKTLKQAYNSGLFTKLMLERGEPSPNKGLWCNFCRAKPDCPAFRVPVAP